MISRSTLARTAQQAARQSCRVQRRTYAAAASTGSYETSDASGLKIASRDAHGPTTKLAVVAKAGTRYQPLPGLTAGLAEFAFKNTQRRSALRITRESELLGGQLASSHSRETVVVEANFLREDLPYFTELLAEVISMTKYTTHEFHEDVERVLHHKQAALNADVAATALDNAHAIAFHSGLGSSILPSSSTPYQKYMNEEYIASYADVAYAKSNIALVADGASADSLSKWVGQFFNDVPSAPETARPSRPRPPSTLVVSSEQTPPPVTLSSLPSPAPVTTLPNLRTLSWLLSSVASPLSSGLPASACWPRPPLALLVSLSTPPTSYTPMPVSWPSSSAALPPLFARVPRRPLRFSRPSLMARLARRISRRPSPTPSSTS
ncbi:hypothetical protein NXS19_000777 [Fusarium pseudograminearum]|nr:hypothetical protein NXS19_000777 [Fusarium pseudograminearum]